VAYRFVGFSRAVFANALLLATTALIGVRVAFGGLRGYLRTHRAAAHRVLLYGAGDGGSLALRVMGLEPNRDMRAVGFVDDDPSKQRLRMHGLRVLGTGQQVVELCRRHGVDEVILTVDTLPPGQLQALRECCAREGVRLSRLEAGFARVDEPTRAPAARVRAGAA
jgi:FlaA1/EpsC-like NDP-sugar epimerase